MRPLAACLLLTVLVPSFAADGQAVSTMATHADAKAPASAGIANERQKSESQSSTMSAGRAKAETKADKAEAKTDKADARADKPRAEKKAEHKTKAAPPPPATVGDQSVCDLTPHPSWCDQ